MNKHSSVKLISCELKEIENTPFKYQWQQVLLAFFILYATRQITSTKDFETKM